MTAAATATAPLIESRTPSTSIPTPTPTPQLCSGTLRCKLKRSRKQLADLTPETRAKALIPKVRPCKAMAVYRVGRALYCDFCFNKYIETHWNDIGRVERLSDDEEDFVCAGRGGKKARRKVDRDSEPICQVPKPHARRGR